MAYSAFEQAITIEVLILYLAAIFWTLGYDTIYGAQDMSDDEIIGLKSTAIKFKKEIKLFVAVSYTIAILMTLYLFKDYIGFNISALLLLMFLLSLYYQLIAFKKHQPDTCLRMFKFNNFTGLILFLSILSINI
jgi:4-hydroxybenzoate polyprenyltransferase